MRLAFALILLSFVFACSGGRDVHGAKRYLRIDERGFEFFEDRDLSVLDFGTLVHKGGYDYEISQGYRALSSPGAFIIPDVSEDQYILFESHGDDTTFYVSDSDDIDLSSVRIGRPYPFYPDGATSLRLNVTDLEPWNVDDDLEIVVPNIDAVLPIDAIVTGTPAADATSATLTYDWVDLRVPLINSAEGDTVFITQLEEKSEGDNSWLAVTRADVGGVIMPNQSRSEIDVALEAVPQDETFRADVRGTSIEALRASVHEGAVYEGSIIEVGALLGAAKHGYHSQPASLARFFLSSTPTDFTADITYGNPFPDTWDQLVAVELVYTVQVAAMDATTTATIPLTIGWVDMLASAAPIEPRLTPVRNVTIDGNDARQNLAGISNEPLIRWSPPERGTAHAYRLTVYATQRRMDGTTAIGRFVEIYTAEPGFQFPTGTLVSGPIYFLAITTYDEPSRDVPRAPFRHQLPAAHATMLTGGFVP